MAKNTTNNLKTIFGNREICENYFGLFIASNNISEISFEFNIVCCHSNPSIKERQMEFDEFNFTYHFPYNMDENIEYFKLIIWLYV